MSVDIAKIVGAFRAESPQKITSETAYEKSHKFTQVFDDSVNDLKSLENSKLQAAQIAKYSQLHLLHGLFSTDEKGERTIFSQTCGSLNLWKRQLPRKVIFLTDIMLRNNRLCCNRNRAIAVRLIK